MNYRQDIDGLRTFAVFGVILFHAGFTFIPGGFAGVDIFFTISGFLISGIIIDNLEAGKFKFSKFFIRRVRRLFPALLFTIIISIFLAFFIFNADNLLRLVKSAAMAIVSLSNIHFASQVGYWDKAAETKVLLHTWSLSVEEQFYLVWPALLALIFGSSLRKNALRVLLILFFLSLGITVYFTYQQSQTYAFYLMPFRAYEFLIGSIAYYYLRNPGKVLSKIFSEFISFVGLSLIFISFIFLDENLTFPGYLALLPCFGTFFIISSKDSFINKYILSNKRVVWFGKISYSLYLVHWPIFAFYRYKFPGEIEPIFQIILILSTILLAALLFYFIESPLRLSSQNSFQISNKRFGNIILPPFTIVILLIVSIYNSDGKLFFKPDNSLSKLLNTTSTVS
jgi:peptidoglycan/LPS O-acetylase OafA/YrhL